MNDLLNKVMEELNLSITIANSRYGCGFMAMLYPASKAEEGPSILDNFTDGDSVYAEVSIWFNNDWFPYVTADTVDDCLNKLSAILETIPSVAGISQRDYIYAMEFHIQDYLRTDLPQESFFEKEVRGRRNLQQALKLFTG